MIAEKCEKKNNGENIQMTNFVIIRGLPGSGKTTFAKTNFQNYLHYDLDYLFCDINANYRYEEQIRPIAEQLLYQLVSTALCKKESVVLTEVFPTKDSLHLYMELAAYHNLQPTIITLTNSSYDSIHNVPKHVFDRLAETFDYSISPITQF